MLNQRAAWQRGVLGIGSSGKPWAGHGTVGNLLPTREHSSQNVCRLHDRSRGCRVVILGRLNHHVGRMDSFYLYQRDNPEDVGLPAMVEAVEVPQANDDAVATEGLFAGWNRQVVVTIFLMGGCYFTFKFLRYALDSWGPLAIEELFGTDAATAGYISTVFDWVGFAGVLAAGWASDHLFAGRRYQTILLMTAGMVLTFIFLAMAGMHNVWLFAVGLSLCGFMLMGPDSLIAGVGAIDIGGRRGAIVAAGLINGIGSIGPIFQEEVIGWVLDHYGYRASLSLLVMMAILAVFGTAFLAHRCRKNLASL